MSNNRCDYDLGEAPRGDLRLEQIRADLAAWRSLMRAIREAETK